MLRSTVSAAEKRILEKETVIQPWHRRTYNFAATVGAVSPCADCHILRLGSPVSLLSMPPFNRPERRALSPEERVLLEWLIANGNPDAKQYASQLSDTKVVGLCTYANFICASFC